MPEQTRVILVETDREGPEELARYQARGGYAGLRQALGGTPEAVLQAVEEAGLRGRGGAGFPTARKWQAAREAPGSPKYVVANGAEGEPGSLKDRYLMERYPHAVLEGLVLAAYTVGAATAYILVHDDYHDTIASLQGALAEAAAAGLVGDNILGSGFSLQVVLHATPASYLAGEETGALEIIEGKAPVPRVKPPYPTAEGLFGKPTVVNNVETLANLPAIVREGPAWFRRQGTPASPGTALFSLTGDVRRPGVYELPLGTPLRRLLEECGGGTLDGRPPKAISPGGPSTGFLTAAHLDLPLDHASLREARSSLGCGAVIVYGAGTCMVEVAEKYARFFAAETCRTCAPCAIGNDMMLNFVGIMRSGEAASYTLTQAAHVVTYTEGRGACGLLAGASEPFGSALRLFAADFEHHLQHGRCPEPTVAATAG